MDKKDLLLHRQVHPSFIQGDQFSSQVFTSQVFTPTPKDEKLLSVYNGDYFEAEDSYIHYTEDRGLKSSGVVSISEPECEQIELKVNQDNDPFEGHASIDYTELGNKVIKKKAKYLKSKAQKRGWTYKP